MSKLVTILISFCIMLSSCANIMTAKDIEEFEPYQKTFVTHSKGKYTLEKVKKTLIHMYTYRKFDHKLKMWVDDDSTVGICYPIGLITINKIWWNENFDPLKREQLIFHELGHCLLKKSHTRPTVNKGLVGRLENLMFNLKFMTEVPHLSDKCPPSYMDPNVFDVVYESYVSLKTVNCLEKHYHYYMEELFGRITRDEYEKNGHNLPN